VKIEHVQSPAGTADGLCRVRRQDTSEYAFLRDPFCVTISIPPIIQFLNMQKRMGLSSAAPDGGGWLPFKWNRETGRSRRGNQKSKNHPKKTNRTKA
jgi:hypothetical protein